MVTRMKISFRSKQLCDIMPQIFSPGSCRVIKYGKEFIFDFEDTESSVRHEDGFLFVDCLYRNYDESLDLPLELADSKLRTLAKEDFIEVNYECYSDLSEDHLIEMIPMDITFYDFSESGDGKPIEVKGNGFINIEE